MDLNKTFECSVEFRLCNQLKVVKLWQGTQGLPSMYLVLQSWVWFSRCLGCSVLWKGKGQW